MKKVITIKFIQIKLYLGEKKQFTITLSTSDNVILSFHHMLHN